MEWTKKTAAHDVSLKTRMGRFLYAHRAMPRRVLTVLAPGPVLVDLGDFRMYVRLDDWLIGARIWLRRSYEKYVADVMRPLLKPGDVMLDLGANVGYFTLLGASRVGDRGHVLAFEPSAGNCALIEASARENGFKNIVLYQKAVGERAGTVGFEPEDSNGKILRGARNDKTRVEMVALDECLSAQARVDLVKMDIEGAEALALAGMTRLLTRFHPVLFSEFHPAALAETSQIQPEAYLGALRALGYQLFVIDRERGLRAQPSSDTEIFKAYQDSPYEHIDLVAFPTLLSSSLNLSSVK